MRILLRRRSESRIPFDIVPSRLRPRRGLRANLFPPPVRSWDGKGPQQYRHNQKLLPRFPATSTGDSELLLRPQEIRSCEELLTGSQAPKSEKDRHLPAAESRRLRADEQSAS